jgi:predicted nucleic acid-binding protein
LLAVAVLSADQIVDLLRKERRDAVSAVRKEVVEVKREQLEPAEVGRITERLIRASQPTPAQTRREVDRALRRLTVRQRQHLLNSLLRVATKRQRRIILGLVAPPPIQLKPSVPLRAPSPIPRSVNPPVVTPPVVDVPPIVPQVTPRPPLDDDGDDEDDEDENDDESGNGG